MTKLEMLVAKVSELPERRRDELVDALSQLVELAASDGQTPAWHLDELQRRLDGPDDFASDAEVEAFFAHE